MSSPFLAEIRIFAGTFAPRGWAMCNGQLMSIAQNTALFSLIGTYYGGNGQTTFALPNFQNSVPIHQGQGAGLSPYVVGEAGGSNTVTLIGSQVPLHDHTAQAVAGLGQSPTPTNNLWAEARVGRSTVKMYSDDLTNPAALSPSALGPAGGSGAHNNVPPVLAMIYIIALQGIYPARN